MKKCLCLFAVCFCLLNFSFSQTKILFLGNSFTSYQYSVPATFSAIASAAGVSVTVDSRTKPGMAVADEQMTGHAADPTSQAKIISQQWDYVVVQDNQGDFAGSTGSVPSWCTAANTTLYGQIKANDSCTRIIYFAGWGPVGGTSGSDNTTACINRIHNNSIVLNNSVANEIVTPIGKAWIASMSQLPGENLYYTDNTHPSEAGVYLAAATIFTTIFKMDLTNVNYSGYINSVSAQTMRTIAFNTVTDVAIYPASHLNAFTPAITVNGSMLTCPGTYSSYQWYANGNPVGTNLNSYTATANGTHKVVVANSAGCLMSSFEVSLTTVGVVPYEDQTGVTIKTITSNIYEVLSQDPGQLSVFNIQGELIRAPEKTETNSRIDLSSRAPGIYIIVFSNSQRRVFKKISIM